MWLGLILVLLFSNNQEKDVLRWIFLGGKGFLETSIIIAGMIGIELSKAKGEKRMYCLWKGLVAVVSTMHFLDIADSLGASICAF